MKLASPLTILLSNFKLHFVTKIKIQYNEIDNDPLYLIYPRHSDSRRCNWLSYLLDALLIMWFLFLNLRKENLVITATDSPLSNSKSKSLK